MNYKHTNPFIAHAFLCIHIGTPIGAEDQGGHQLEVSEFECTNYEPNQGKPRCITHAFKSFALLHM